MAMKESVRSLRLYFILSGLATLWFSFVTFIPVLRASISATVIVLVVFGVVFFAMSLAFLYVGFFLRRLLKDSSHRIVMLIYAGMVWVVLSFLGTLFAGVELREIVGDALSLLLGFYLLKNVRRLASQEQDPTLGALPGN
jgi:L-lactate permease